MEQLKSILNFVTKFPEADLAQIVAVFKSKKVKQGEILLASGETCKEFYIVSSGVIRTFFVDKKGNEKTRYILPTNYMGTALSSFVECRPSIEMMDALQDSVLFAISRHDFYNLNEKLLSWKKFYQKILEMAYSFQTRKIESIMTLTAQQRFEQAMKESPQLFQLVSNKVLASYLDMTPETLSRLKSR
ncbi:MAG: Crp/Fnr family transcriptional regulator [Bacteroidia bacterium]|nr:Crp/Fnr family transcriptional regulator [Bacteroidia bacterium]